MTVVQTISTTERNKLIAAGLLGLLALMALYFAFGRSLIGGGSSAAGKATPTPRSSINLTVDQQPIKVPTTSEQNFVYQTTPIDYRPGNAYAPDAGRNIFAFYEPPPPTPYVPPTPTPEVIRTPVPTPTPALLVGFVTPQVVYAGDKAFRLEINGDRFTPDSRIYFSQSEIPTTFINAQKLVADIPSNFIAQEGPRQIIVQTPDGRKYSNQVMLQVQAPPRPTFTYIGMIGRKRYNNDTAYFIEAGKTVPFAARLNDAIGGRFRIVNIAPTEVIVEDISLGFRHPIPVAKQAATSGSPAGQPNRGFPEPGFSPFNPGNMPQNEIPGIPSNIPRYVPPQPQRTPTDNKKDVDDDGDGDR